MNLDYVDIARVEDLSSIVGADGMNLNAMSLEELLYFALVEKAESASVGGVTEGLRMLG